MVQELKTFSDQSGNLMYFMSIFVFVSGCEPSL